MWIVCAVRPTKKRELHILKIVGRGNYTEFMQQDIIRVEKSAYDLETAETKKRIPGSYETGIGSQMGAVKNCYY